MRDLIDRQAAVNVLDVMISTIAEKEVRKGVSMAWQQIKDLPSAQQTICKYWDAESDFCTLYRPSAQPDIVRCKDCKHGMYDMMCKFYWCHGVAHSANWYCADAERRTDE